MYVNSFCDANISVDALGGEPTASDNCDVCFDQNLEISYTENTQVICGEDATSGSRILTRTWTVVDQCGNARTDDQVITIIDNEAPVFGIGGFTGAFAPEAWTLTEGVSIDSDTIEGYNSDDYRKMSCMRLA